LEHRDHWIAMIAEAGAAPEVRIWEASLQGAPARQIAVAQENWFPRH